MQQWDELLDYTILRLDLSPSLTGGVSGRLGLNLVDLTPPRSRFFTRIGHVFSRDTRLFASLQVPPSGRIQMVPFRSFGMGSFRGNVKPSFVRN